MQSVYDGGAFVSLSYDARKTLTGLQWAGL